MRHSLYPRPPTSSDCKYDCQNDTYHKQYPSDISGCSGNSSKPEYRSYETYNKECNCPTKHSDILQEFSMFIYDRASGNCHNRTFAVSVPFSLELFGRGITALKIRGYSTIPSSASSGDTPNIVLPRTRSANRITRFFYFLARSLSQPPVRIYGLAAFCYSQHRTANR